MSRVIGLDVGCAVPDTSPQSGARAVLDMTLSNAVFIPPYQTALALSFAVGALLGTRAGDLCLTITAALVVALRLSPCPHDSPFRLPNLHMVSL